jgi:hypothetical protein
MLLIWLKKRMIWKTERIKSEKILPERKAAQEEMPPQRESQIRTEMENCWKVSFISENTHLNYFEKKQKLTSQLSHTNSSTHSSPSIRQRALICPDLVDDSLAPSSLIWIKKISICTCKMSNAKLTICKWLSSFVSRLCFLCLHQL